MRSTERQRVPTGINGSTPYERDDLRVPFTKAVVKDAPRVDEEMTELQEQERWSYYGYDDAATPVSDS
jgi:hypothetical protein